MTRKLFTTCTMVSASDFPPKIKQEMLEAGTSTRYQASIVHVEQEYTPVFFAWLVEIGAIAADSEITRIVIDPT